MEPEWRLASARGMGELIQIHHPTTVALSRRNLIRLECLFLLLGVEGRE